MSEQVLERGDTYRIYTSDRLGPQVPYLPMKDIHGRQDHGYVDLRDKPDAVARIPEAHDQPGFAVFLQAVNSPGSALMSVACAVQLATVREGAVAAESGESPTHFVDSTVDVTVREPLLATTGNMLALAQGLMQLRRAQPGEWGSYDIGIVRLKSLYGVNNVTALDIRLRAMGAGEEAAWENFNFHWTQLAAAVRKLKIGVEPSRPTS